MNNEIKTIAIIFGITYATIVAYVGYKILLEVWCIAYGLFY